MEVDSKHGLVWLAWQEVLVIASAGQYLPATMAAALLADEVFDRILSVTSEFKACSTGLRFILDESVLVANCQDVRIVNLEKRQARSKALAIFRDPIEAFRQCVAEEAGHESWQMLATNLYLEQHKEVKNARAKVGDALLRMGLDLCVWDDISSVADAGSMGSHQGKETHPRLLRRLVTDGACKAAVHLWRVCWIG